MSGQTSHGGASHGSVKSYIIGFLLCVVLTLIPFGMVMSGEFSNLTNILTIVATAIVQIYVQLFFFLHLDTSSEQRWNLVAFLFSLVVIIVVVGGSIWIMRELNYFMM
ncbi:MAG: cytochrome o ubiquinol oxidase subunit IV [Cellvibrionales bacterium]|nr:cytochrome o ubiquinol oxidase subunit IV [Cellvibrionales bacterium]